MYKLVLAPADSQKCSLREFNNNESFKRKMFGQWAVFSFKVLNLDMIRWLGSLSDVFIKSGLNEMFAEIVYECEFDAQTRVCRYKNFEELCKTYGTLEENKLVEKITLGFSYEKLQLLVEYDLIDDYTRVRVPIKYKTSDFNGMINRAVSLYNEANIKILDVIK